MFFIHDTFFEKTTNTTARGCTALRDGSMERMFFCFFRVGICYFCTFAD